MRKSMATGLIRIIKVPDGDPPLWVRQAWLHLILPCDPYLGFPEGGLERGIVSGKEVTHNRYGYSVPPEEALKILRQFKPKEADWWKDNVVFKPGDYLGFAEDEAEIISGVTRQRLVEVTDEMQGDPYR